MNSIEETKAHLQKQASDEHLRQQQRKAEAAMYENMAAAPAPIDFTPYIPMIEDGKWVVLPSGEKIEIRNKWDLAMEHMQPQGQWVLTATEKGDTMRGGIAIKPHRDIFGRVVAVGPGVTKVKLAPGDRVCWKEGVQPLTTECIEYPSRIYALVYELHIVCKIPAHIEVPKYGER